MLPDGKDEELVRPRLNGLVLSSVEEARSRPCRWWWLSRDGGGGGCSQASSVVQRQPKGAGAGEGDSVRSQFNVYHSVDSVTGQARDLIP